MKLLDTFTIIVTIIVFAIRNLFPDIPLEEPGLYTLIAWILIRLGFNSRRLYIKKL